MKQDPSPTPEAVAKQLHAMLIEIYSLCCQNKLPLFVLTGIYSTKALPEYEKFTNPPTEHDFDFGPGLLATASRFANSLPAQRWTNGDVFETRDALKVGQAIADCTDIVLSRKELDLGRQAFYQIMNNLKDHE